MPPSCAKISQVVSNSVRVPQNKVGSSALFCIIRLQHRITHLQLQCYCTAKLIYRFAAIAAEGAMPDAIPTSNLSRINDWPLILTAFLFGHKSFV